MIIDERLRCSSSCFATFVNCLLLLRSDVVSGQSYPKCLTQKGSCACMTDKGLIDLSPLDSKDENKPQFDGIKDPSDPSYTTWSYNPCSSFNQGTGCPKVAICQRSYPYDTPYGTQDSAKFQTDASQKLTIRYSSSYTTTDVVLECDSSDPGTMTVVKSDYPNCQMTLKSKYACPKSDSGSGKLSVGTILCIVFVVVIFVYLVAGILIMRFHFGARGVDQIPNLVVWKEIPSYVKDGARFVTSPCCRSSTGYYEKV